MPAWDPVLWVQCSLSNASHQVCPGAQVHCSDTSPPLQVVVSHVLSSQGLFSSCPLNKCHGNKALDGSGDQPKHELCKWHQAKCPALLQHGNGLFRALPLPQSSCRKRHPQGRDGTCPSYRVYKISTFFLGYGEEGVGSGGTTRVPPGRRAASIQLYPGYPGKRFSSCLCIL